MAKAKVKRTRRPSGVARWEKWTDPRETENDFAKWKKAHVDYMHLQATSQMRDVVNSIPEGAPIALLAARSGLCQATVSRYVRKHNMGRKGPYLSTYLALKAAGTGEDQ